MAIVEKLPAFMTTTWFILGIISVIFAIGIIWWLHKQYFSPFSKK